MKGLSKRMIVVKNTGSALIEEAYFVLKASPGGHSPFRNERDFVREAERLIAEQGILPDGRAHPEKPPRTRFWCGLFIGLLAGLGVFFVTRLWR